MKQKRTGDIKGMMVAGGNKQRGYINKEDLSSPTVSTESVILTSLVNALEGRKTAIINVPNAFIQTVVRDESQCIIICIRGMLVDILVKIAPEVYSDYVTMKQTITSGVSQCIVQDNDSKSSSLP